MKPLNIWLVSIFEQTPIDNVFSTRFICIAKEAVSRGHRVTFFASTFKHNTKNQRFDDTKVVPMEDNYQLVFVKSDAYSSNISLKRLWAHQRFGKAIIPELQKRKKPDIILMAFPPVSLAYEVTRWANQMKVPVILDIIDPWPDTFRNVFPTMLKPIGSWILRPMTKKLQSTLGKVTGVTAISKQYLQWAKTYQPKLDNLHCFYPAADLKETQSLIHAALNDHPKANEPFSVVYAGSLASSYDIPCIARAAAILDKKYGKKIMFKIAGVGPQQPLIEQFISEHTNMQYFGRLPKDELMRIYAHCDLGLTQHVKGATQSVTYKLFDLLASGLPILNSLQSEMKDIIQDHKVGLNNQPGDHTELVNNIEKFYLNRSMLEEYKANSYKLTEKTGDISAVYPKVVDLLEKTKL